jgi:hypothetical protein
VIAQDKRPIAFLSRILSKTQQRYSVTKIELKAIVEILKEFNGILWGQSIKVFTDHKNLTRDALGLTSDRIPMEVTFRSNIYKRDLSYICGCNFAATI